MHLAASVKNISLTVLSVLTLYSCGTSTADTAVNEINDSNTPLHLLKAEYKVPYGIPDTDSVKAVMDRVFNHIDRATPACVTSGKINQGTYRLTSYEWGVMYDALLDAAKITGDNRYSKYVSDRIGFLASQASSRKGDAESDGQLRQVVNPATLDDAGAMSGAWMRAQMADSSLNLRDIIENYWQVVENAPIKLADGTIARNRPHHSAVWLDDMFMALPSIAVRSVYTGDDSHLNRAAEIAHGFIKRMWMPEKRIFRHGYVEGKDFQPSFAWGRANGWAILTLSQLLDYLPEGHARRDEIMHIFQEHASGLASLQGVDGFWHQLLDHPETYEETSATAIFAYALAHGVNEGWLDAATFGPVAQLAWNAVVSRINAEGEIEGVCVGTGMGFDPAFYAYRPTSVKAAHGYGVTMWAGAEMIRLLSSQYPKSNDSAVHYYKIDPENDNPLFSLDENGKALTVLH